MAEQTTQPPKQDDVTNKLDAIEKKLDTAARRDMQAAWLAFAVLGAGFVVVGMKDVPLVYPYNLLVVLVGVAMLIGAFCKVKSISKRQR